MSRTVVDTVLLTADSERDYIRRCQARHCFGWLLEGGACTKAVGPHGYYFRNTYRWKRISRGWGRVFEPMTWADTLHTLWVWFWGVHEDVE